MLLYIKAFLHSCECVLQHICNSSVSNVLLLCNKSITIASHRQGVSVDFLRGNAKEIKISRSENVSQAQQVHPRYRKFVTSVLRFTVFRIVSSHLTCCILFFYTFSAVFFMHFSVCLLAYMHISKCNRLLCALFPSHSPPAALFWAAAGLWLYFLQQKTAQAAFSGPSVLCRIPYIKRRAAPKSRPPTIQAML